LFEDHVDNEIVAEPLVFAAIILSHAIRYQQQTRERRGKKKKQRNKEKKRKKKEKT